MKKLNLNKTDLSSIKRHLVLLGNEMIFTILFVMMGLVGCFITYSSFNKESFIRWDNSIKVSGFIVSINETHFGMGGDISTASIFEYEYRYLFEGSIHAGKSYSTGIRLNKNDEITVLVQEKNFDESKILGGSFRSSPFPVWGLGIIILPIYMLYICYSNTRESLKVFAIIEKGVLTTGTYFHSKETNEEQNDMKLYEHNIKYIVENEEVIARHTSTDKVLKDKLNIVYNQQQKEEFIILDHLPVLFRKKMIKRLKTSI